MNVLSKLIAFSGPLGIYDFARLLTKREPKVLMYHRFSHEKKRDFTSAKAFDAQVAHIKKHYNPMTVTQIAHAIFENGALPEHAIAVTVDDGYRDFYEVAFPILKKHGVPATFYVTTGFINRDLWLWPDQVNWLVKHSTVREKDTNLGALELPANLSEAELWGKIVSYLLKVSDEQKHAMIRSLSASWGVELPAVAPDVYAAATWAHLQEMQDAGIEIGGHTVTHPSLGRVSIEQALKEIEGCRDDLNQNLGIASRSFCYPNGTPSDYSSELEEVVERASFSAAVVAFADTGGMDKRFSLRRHSSGEGRFQFEKSVSGVELLGHRLRGRLQGRNAPAAG